MPNWDKIAFVCFYTAVTVLLKTHRWSHTMCVLYLTLQRQWICEALYVYTQISKTYDTERGHYEKINWNLLYLRRTLLNALSAVCSPPGGATVRMWTLQATVHTSYVFNMKQWEGDHVFLCNKSLMSYIYAIIHLVWLFTGSKEAREAVFK